MILSNITWQSFLISIGTLSFVSLFTIPNGIIRMDATGIPIPRPDNLIKIMLSPLYILQFWTSLPLIVTNFFIHWAVVFGVMYASKSRNSRSRQ
jgi:hypothetical protein